MHPWSYYLKLRVKYQPEKIRLIFVLESPPVSGNFFYDPSGRVTEPLFSAMMKLIGQEPSTKEAGLVAFARNGFFLVDATYQCVNHIKSEKQRNQTILSDLPELIKDLKGISSSRQNTVKFVLVKANICRLLEEPIKAEGMKVINNGTVIPFPSHGHQNKFQESIRRVLKVAKIL